MNTTQRIKFITKWIKDYAAKNKIKTLVVGVSGGIDSSVVSTLCCKTGIDTVVVSMPIRQKKELDKLSLAHADWLSENFRKLKIVRQDLTPVFNSFVKSAGSDYQNNNLALANTRARLRMITLYNIAQCEGGIVVGTGNKVEDFGVGFFTKYGDGGVDISPIADCTKSEVWDMGRELGILQEIIDAPPTDGLWDDGRTDESQLGMGYDELEYAMKLSTNFQANTASAKAKAMVKKYRAIRAKSLHKMVPIPICVLPK